LLFASNSVSAGASPRNLLRELTVYSAPPDPLAVFKGPTYKGGTDGKGNGEQKEREVQGKGGDGG